MKPDPQFRVRDQRKPNHHWADNEVLDDFGPRIGVFGYSVYMYICRWAGNHDGRCTRSQREIGRAFRISTDTVGRAIQKLIEAKLITKQDEPGRPSEFIVLEVPKRLRPTAHSGTHLPPAAAPGTAHSGKQLPPRADGLPLTAEHLPLTAAPNKEERLSQDFSQDSKAGRRRMSPAERDTWDLRRWQRCMEQSQPQPGTYIPDVNANWRERARAAAYQAGLSPDRITELLKQHFPNDEDVQKLYADGPLFDGREQSA